MSIPYRYGTTESENTEVSSESCECQFLIGTVPHAGEGEAMKKHLVSIPYRYGTTTMTKNEAKNFSTTPCVNSL